MGPGMASHERTNQPASYGSLIIISFALHGLKCVKILLKLSSFPKWGPFFYNLGSSCVIEKRNEASSFYKKNQTKEHLTRCYMH